MRKAVIATFSFVLLSASIVLPLVTGIGRAEANGEPVKIILTYLDGVSNWGPTNATGVAEVVRQDGEVKFNIAGLTPLADETYTGWLVNTGTNETMNVGQFNADQSGVVKVTLEEPVEFPDKGWNLVLVTVEAKGPAASNPNDRKSVAGYYPNRPQGTQAPAQLPQTGGDTNPNTSLNNPAPAANNQTQVSSNSPASAPADKASSRFDGTNNLFVYGAIVIAMLGLGLYTRVRTTRRR